MTTEYEMCEHGRHIGAVCLPCAEKEMIYDKSVEFGVADYYNSRDGELMSDDIVGDADQKYFIPSHIEAYSQADYYNPQEKEYINAPAGSFPREPEYVDPFDMKPEPVDEVNNPKHYTVGGYEAIDVIRAKLTPEEYIGGLKWQIMKYVMRANYKGRHDQDCEKAIWYANELKNFLQQQRNAKSVDTKG